MAEYFGNIPSIKYEGRDSKNPFAFKNNFYLIISNIYSPKKIIFHLFPHVRRTRRKQNPTKR